MIKYLQQKHRVLCLQVHAGMVRHSRVILFLLGATLLLTNLSTVSFAQDKYGDVCSTIVKMFSDESFGSLLASLAGLGAICASAMGGFKMAWALLVVSLGSYLLNAYIGLFFEQC